MTGGIHLGEAAARRLAELDCCEIAPGLTDAEFTRIERRYGFEFADDHRAFLAAGLPVNRPFVPVEGVYETWEKPWPDWRDGTTEELRGHLDWPIEGVLSGYWNSEWGVQPPTPEAAAAVARQHLANVPRMVPIYAHRFLPAGRGTFGHPVLSMWGTDIICYGTDLADYVDREFQGLDSPSDEVLPLITVPFWGDFLERPP